MRVVLFYYSRHHEIEYIMTDEYDDDIAAQCPALSPPPPGMVSRIFRFIQVMIAPRAGIAKCALECHVGYFQRCYFSIWLLPFYFRFPTLFFRHGHTLAKLIMTQRALRRQKQRETRRRVSFLWYRLIFRHFGMILWYYDARRVGLGRRRLGISPHARTSLIIIEAPPCCGYSIKRTLDMAISCT